MATTVPEGMELRADGCICPVEQEEVVVEKPKTCPFPEVCPHDPRFPNTNQTRHCYFSFIDFQRCTRLLGDYPGCKIFYRCYTDLCPAAWTERWYDQMEAGTFPRRIYPLGPVVRPDPAKMREICLEPEIKPEATC